MKKKKVLVTVVYLIFTFTFVGCMAGTEEEKAKSMESIEERGAEEKVTDTEEDEAAVKEAERNANANAKEELEEETKINYTKFEDLSLAAEQVGFSFRAVEETEDAYFSSFSITEGQDEDEEGNKVGDPYPMVVLQYNQKANKRNAFKIIIHPTQGEAEPPATYVLTEEIEGIAVSLTDYVLMLVMPDYELTEEDWEFVNSGKGSFSVDGETVGESHFRDMYWQEEDIFYRFETQKPDLSAEVVREIVRAILKSELK